MWRSLFLWCDCSFLYFDQRWMRLYFCLLCIACDVFRSCLLLQKTCSSANWKSEYQVSFMLIQIFHITQHMESDIWPIYLRGNVFYPVGWTSLLVFVWVSRLEVIWKQCHYTVYLADTLFTARHVWGKRKSREEASVLSLFVTQCSVEMSSFQMFRPNNFKILNLLNSICDIYSRKCIDLVSWCLFLEGNESLVCMFSQPWK